MSEALMISARGLSYRHGETWALRSLTFSVAAGEAVALLGPNGAGKSTLLHILATLSKPDAGEVQLGGWPLPAAANHVRRHIGFVGHESLLYRDLSGVENLQFMGRLYGLETPAPRIEAALQQVGLAARQHDPVGSYSRGMVQRLAIARATLHEPDVLLLDEPFNGLDTPGTAVLTALLQKHRAAGRTILMVTHQLAQAQTLSDRLLVLRRGRLVADEAAAALDDAQLEALYAGDSVTA